MTVVNLTVKQLYSPGISDTTFAIPFDYNETSQISVYTVLSGVETLEVYGVDYDIVGSNVVFTIAPNASNNSTKVLLIRESDYDQQTDYDESGDFPADSHEDALDYLTHLTQELKEKLSRAMLLRASSTLSNIQFPDPGAGKYIRWNSDGDELEASSSGLWLTTGNDSVSASDFIGPTNSADLKFRTNNIQRGRIKSTGEWVLGPLTFPTTDGSSGQVLQTDGSGNLSFATPSGGGSSSSSFLRSILLMGG